uniref:Uncharacterized protein n=1 Tax=Pipistrellus kuhlii TaxID=59472 RepID=A0A7J7T0X1_PIPKU|nr:hypothetical protein mPipKuh1_009729 [Pipistrellus kuhlii]
MRPPSKTQGNGAPGRACWEGRRGESPSPGAHLRGFPAHTQRPLHSRSVPGGGPAGCQSGRASPDAGWARPVGGQARLQVSGDPSTPRGRAHTGRRSPEPGEMAQMGCPRPGTFRDRARGQVLPEASERAAPSKF